MKVIVRWWDGYLQVFCDVIEWRAGAYILWIKDKKETRYIPLLQVRWFEPIPSDREYMLSIRSIGETGGEK